MKKLGKKIIIIIALIVLSVVGVSYAFFDYYKIGKNSKLIAGDIYLDYIDKTESISLTNIYPETTKEARSRTDNVINFSVAGGNTSTNTIYYEVRLNEGEEISGKTRFNPEDIKIDLSEVNSDGTETLLFGALSFDEFKDTKIWVDKVKASGSINKNYKLRFWLSNNVLISDTEPDADYTTSDFENSYVSIKVTVYGDFEEKELPYSYMANKSGGDKFWPTNIAAEKANITVVNFIKMDEPEMTTRYNTSTIKADVTDTTKSAAGSVLAWLETNADDNTKYTMYVASEGIIFFPKSSWYMFYKFTNLVNVETENVITSQVTSMSSMFYDCSGLTSLDVSGFDTGGVTSMSSMFSDCSGLTSLDVSNWDTSNVMNMSNMFRGCKSIIVLDVSGFDTGGVTSMLQMFSGCSSLTSLDVSNWNTGNVTDIRNMFYNCSNLTSLDMSNCNLSGVTDMSQMFYTCPNLTSLDMSNCNLSSVTNMSLMFKNCSSLTNLDVSEWDTSSVLTMSEMFTNCRSLTSLDVSHFDTSKVTDMFRMFGGCSSLTNLDVSKWDTSSVTGSGEATKLDGMSFMFNGCSSLTSLDVSNFDTSMVTNMQYMFGGCSSLTSLDVSNFDTSMVTNMGYMFRDCSSLTSLDVSNFDTSMVTYMEYMFNGCSSLTTVYSNIDWNTDSVTSSGGMFSGCLKLVGAVALDSTKVDVTYANPTTGYFTKKTTA